MLALVSDTMRLFPILLFLYPVNVQRPCDMPLCIHNTDVNVLGFTCSCFTLLLMSDFQFFQSGCRFLDN